MSKIVRRFKKKNIIKFCEKKMSFFQRRNPHQRGWGGFMHPMFKEVVPVKQFYREEILTTPPAKIISKKKPSVATVEKGESGKRPPNLSAAKRLVTESLQSAIKKRGEGEGDDAAAGEKVGENRKRKRGEEICFAAAEFGEASKEKKQKKYRDLFEEDFSRE